jgi:flagellar hook-length control protein FliK
MFFDFSSILSNLTSVKSNDTEEIAPGKNYKNESFDRGGNIDSTKADKKNFGNANKKDEITSDKPNDKIENGRGEEEPEKIKEDREVDSSGPENEETEEVKEAGQQTEGSAEITEAVAPELLAAISQNNPGPVITVSKMEGSGEPLEGQEAAKGDTPQLGQEITAKPQAEIVEAKPLTQEITEAGQKNIINPQGQEATVETAQVAKPKEGAAAAVAKSFAGEALLDTAEAPNQSAKSNEALAGQIALPVEIAAKTETQNFSGNNFGNEFNTSAFIIQNKSINVEKANFKQVFGTNHKVDPKDIINQIVNKMKLEIKDSMSTIRVTLHPETMGDVSLKIVAENGVISAQFIAENDKVKEVIENNFNMLKDALSEKGINVMSLSVSVSSGQSGSAFNPPSFDKQKFSKGAMLFEQGDTGVSDKIVEAAYGLDLYDASVNYEA